jgi:ribosomal protein S10
MKQKTKWIATACAVIVLTIAGTYLKMKGPKPSANQIINKTIVRKGD